MSEIIGFISHKNKYPNSLFEWIGDVLLTPVSTLCGRNSFVILKNEKTNDRCIYTYTNDSKSCFRVIAEIVAAVITLPLALIGILFKGLSLIISPQTQDIYFNWQPPLEAQFNNPEQVEDDYFWEKNRQVGLGQRGRNLLNLTEFAVQKGCAAELLEELIQHPSEYLVATHDNILGDQVHLLPDLSECSCINSGNFNRFKNQRRADLEIQLITDVTKSFPPSNHFRLNYMGFGAGKLLQEFINTGKLIQAGYKDLNIILIDSALKKEIIDNESGKRSPNPVTEQFSFLLKAAEQKEIQIQVQIFKNITDYRQAFPDEKVHIISAIDFDDYQTAFNDVILCHQTLHENGKFYLSYDVHDFCFSATRCIRNKQHGESDPIYISTFENFQKDVSLLSRKLSIKGQKVARYAQLGTEFNFEEWTGLLPELAKYECDTIEFTLMHPLERNYFGAPLGPNAKFTKENLEYYLKLFLPQKTDIQVRLVASINAFKQYVELSGSEFDMVTWWGHSTNDERSAKENIQWLRQHAANSNIYYGIQVYKKETKGELSFEGIWRWSADLGSKHFLSTEPKYRALIDGWME